MYKATINPIDQPATVACRASTSPRRSRRRSSQRTDIVQQRRNLEISELNLEVTKDATRPQLDLSSGYNTSGQGGTRFANGVITEETGYTGALRQLGTFDTSGWNTQLNFTIPLGRDWTRQPGRTTLARCCSSIRPKPISRPPSCASRRRSPTPASRSRTPTSSTRPRRRRAPRRNETRKPRRRDSTTASSTNFKVVQLQNQLTNARLTELGRLIAYVNAVAEFERIQRVGR